MFVLVITADGNRAFAGGLGVLADRNCSITDSKGRIANCSGEITVHRGVETERCPIVAFAIGVSPDHSRSDPFGEGIGANRNRFLFNGFSAQAHRHSTVLGGKAVHADGHGTKTGCNGTFVILVVIVRADGDSTNARRLCHRTDRDRVGLGRQGTISERHRRIAGRLGVKANGVRIEIRCARDAADRHCPFMAGAGLIADGHAARTAGIRAPADPDGRGRVGHTA